MTHIGEREINLYGWLIYKVIATLDYNKEKSRNEITCKIERYEKVSLDEPLTQRFTNTFVEWQDPKLDYDWDNEIAVGHYPEVIFEAMEELCNLGWGLVNGETHYCGFCKALVPKDAINSYIDPFQEEICGNIEDVYYCDNCKTVAMNCRQESLEEI